MVMGVELLKVGAAAMAVGAVVAVAALPLPTVAVAWAGVLVAGAAVAAGALVEVAGTDVGAAGLVGATVAAGVQAMTSKTIAIKEMMILPCLNIFSTSKFNNSGTPLHRLVHLLSFAANHEKQQKYTC